MIKAGVTGGIGSGKSAVCKIFECLGVPVFRADDEGRRLLAEDEEVKKQVVGLLGKDVVSNNTLDRKKMAAVVFNDEHKLSQLNSIVHPVVRNALENWVTKQKSKLVIEEAAILFESGAYKNLDSIILVTAPERLRIERVMKRDKASEAEVKGRMKHQWSEEEKIKKADFVIENDGSQMLIPQVISLYQKLISGQSPEKK